VEVEGRFSRFGAMAARDNPCRAVLGAVIVEEGQGDGDVAWPLGRQVSVQLLVTASGNGLASFHLRKEEPLADQLARRGQ
jgi:hypothetical protein